MNSRAAAGRMLDTTNPNAGSVEKEVGLPLLLKKGIFFFFNENDYIYLSGSSYVGGYRMDDSGALETPFVNYCGSVCAFFFFF